MCKCSALLYVFFLISYVRDFVKRANMLDNPAECHQFFSKDCCHVQLQSMLFLLLFLWFHEVIFSILLTIESEFQHFGWKIQFRLGSIPPSSDLCSPVVLETYFDWTSISKLYPTSIPSICNIPSRLSFRLSIFREPKLQWTANFREKKERK